MITAHIGGVPVEEWATPLTATAGGLVVAFNALVYRLRARRRADRVA